MNWYKLFPIFIVEPDSRWPRLYCDEERKIKSTLGKQNVISIEHIGSTAVKNLKAKPTIDILVEVPAGIEKESIIEKLRNLDYHYTPRPENPAPHMMFMKGYTVEGFKGQAYHLHVRYKGDWDEIYFRDYLVSVRKPPSRGIIA